MLTKRIFILLCSFVLTVMFAACKKDNNAQSPAPGTTDTDSIGPLSVTEFKSVPTPTYQQVIKAFDDLTREKPVLLQDTNALARAIFSWVKAHPNGALFRETQDEQTESLFDITSKLSLEEWKLVIINPYYTYRAFGTVKPSGNAATANYPCDSDVGFEDSKADALRHAYWNALMVRRTDAAYAEKEATAHESESVKASATAMDLHNNRIGRELAVKYPTASDNQLLELLLQHKFYYLSNPDDAIPAEASDALVFFAGKRSYDGTLNGTMTNPDSGGPWSAAFYLNHCGNTIRGEYAITRNTQVQKRRFTGTLNQNGTITLLVSAPYVFENPAGLYVCSDIVVSLKGNENALGGNWVSSNCNLGGSVTLAR